MTDPLSLGLAGTAVVVALAAGWLSLPRPPQLDAQRWFKVSLATLIRGQVELSGGTIDCWEARVLREVPFHPAARRLEQRLADPAAVVVADRIEGEADLIATLLSLATPTERFEHLFEVDHAGREARLSDPVLLGADYDPARLLGAGYGWDAVADWGAEQGTALVDALKRAVGATLVVVGTDGTAPAVLDAFVDLGAHRAAQQDLLAELTELAPSAADRLIVIAAGDALVAVLSALEASAGLRDRVSAVISVGGNCTGRDSGPNDTAHRQDWMAAHFTDASMDLEARRQLVFVAMQWVRRAEPLAPFDGLGVAAARLPQPRRDSPGEPVIASYDLGVIPVDDGPPATLVARALWLSTVLLICNAR